MKMIKVADAQVVKNRKGFKAMWRKIPASWIYLDSYLSSREIDPRATNGRYSREVLAQKCDGVGGPHNPCGAVGCFAGWGWTYHPYQLWCKRHRVKVTSSRNLGVWLGIGTERHELFSARQDAGTKTERQEVLDRIKILMKMPIYEYEQETENE